MWHLNCSMWDLAPWAGIKPALGTQSLKHWNTREAPASLSSDVVQMWRQQWCNLGWVNPSGQVPSPWPQWLILDRTRPNWFTHSEAQNFCSMFKGRKWSLDKSSLLGSGTRQRMRQYHARWSLEMEWQPAPLWHAWVTASTLAGNPRCSEFFHYFEGIYSYVLKIIWVGNLIFWQVN